MFFSRDEDGPASCYIAEIEIMIAGVVYGRRVREERKREGGWGRERERGGGGGSLVPLHYIQGVCIRLKNLSINC